MDLGIVATLIALAGLLAALGHVGYLALLNNAARKKGAVGADIAQRTKSRLPAAAVPGGVALLGLLLTNGGIFLDVVGILLAVGGGVVGYRGLRQEQSRYGTS